MDQVKIGAFIQQLRKEKGLTQKQMAEQLLISDKTVSKWETGKGLPEVALMLPLCQLLGISVNELLSGERQAQPATEEQSDEVLIDLVKEKQESKMKLVLCGIVTAVTILGGVTLVMVSGLAELAVWVRAALLVIGFVVIVGGIAVASILDYQAGTYECRHCSQRFVPTFGAYLKAPHTATTRRLSCPQCGEKSWCKRRLTH